MDDENGDFTTEQHWTGNDLQTSSCNILQFFFFIFFFNFYFLEWAGEEGEAHSHSRRTSYNPFILKHFRSRGLGAWLRHTEILVIA
jgi:hypothetical protein